MKFNLRAQLVATILGCSLPVVVLGFLDLSGWVVSLVALASAAVAAGLSYWLLLPFERLRIAAAEAILQAPCSDNEAVLKLNTKQSEAGLIGQAIWSILERLTTRHQTLLDREAQYFDTLNQVQSSLTAIGSFGKEQLPAIQLKSPWPDRNRAVQETLVALAKQSALTQRRSQVYLAIINELPEAVLVSDEKLNIILTNTAANKLLQSVQGSPKRLADLFVESPENFSHDPDVPAPIGVKQLSELVTHSRSSHFTAIANDDSGTPIAMQLLPANQRTQKGMRVLLARDASQEISSQSEARHRHRRDVGLRMCMLVNKEAGSTLESIRTQASLLTQAAKQAGQREKFIPKINRLLDDLSKQEAIVSLLGWLGRLNQANATQPDNAEVRLRDIVENTSDQLKGLFAERSNTFELQGDAGWIVADEEWIGVLLTGLLLHANHSVQKTVVKCELRRRSGSDTRLRSECSEIQIQYKGEAVSDELLADIRDPFGRLNSSALAPASQSGFPLGLAVAARVARLMGGDMYCETEGEIVHIRVMTPTREKSSNPQSRPLPAANEVVELDVSETLSGWMVGGGKSDSDDSEATTVDQQAVAVVAEEDPIVADETVGGWFGGMRE